MVTNILLAVILALMIASVVGVVLSIRFLWRLVVDFVTPAADNEASPLAKSVDAAGSMLARSIVAQVKTTAMGEMSGAVRAEKAVQGDLAIDLASQNPIAQALMSQFPSLRKTLRRNPGLLDVALSALANRFGAGGNGHSGSSAAVKFKL